MARVPTAITRKREELAWELRIKGLREQRIAEEIEKAGLGRITQQGVSLLLLRVEARALQSMQKRVSGVKARQTDALWLIFEEAMRAWERSQRADTSITKRLTSRSTGILEEGAAPRAHGSEQVTTQIREHAGDPRFLDQARAALADIRRIWGLDAPSKLAPTSPNGEEEWHGTDADRDAILAAAFTRLGLSLGPASGNGPTHIPGPTVGGAGPDLPCGRS
jgi:hypothetical protein